MYPKLMLVLAGICILASGARAADEGLMGYWPFDGALADASGRGHEAVSPQAKYAAGTKGQALDPNWHPVEIASHADLQLTPGLMVDCSVYFDKRPEN